MGQPSGFLTSRKSSLQEENLMSHNCYLGPSQDLLGSKAKNLSELFKNFKN